ACSSAWSSRPANPLDRTVSLIMDAEAAALAEEGADGSDPEPEAHAVARRKGRPPSAGGRGRRGGVPGMTVELSPITDADVAAVADFLHLNYKDRIPWTRSRLAGPWKVEAPNHGFVLRDGQRIVGAFTAFYSERLVAGRMERFCDNGTWYVLPEFRLYSIRLVKALLAQDSYHFSALTPSHKVVSIYSRFGFHPLDTSAPIIPNLPRPAPPP